MQWFPTSSENRKNRFSMSKNNLCTKIPTHRDCVFFGHMQWFPTSSENRENRFSMSKNNLCRKIPTHEDCVFLAICSDFPHFPFQRPKISMSPLPGFFFCHNAVISHTFNLLSYPNRGSNKAATSKRSSWEIFFVFFQTLFPVLFTTILDIFAITSLSKKNPGFAIPKP